MGMEHERYVGLIHIRMVLIKSLLLIRIHLETSTVLLRQLPREFLQCPDNWEYAPPTSTNGPAGPNKFVQVPEGDVVLGKSRDFPTYGWDNEYGHTKIQ